MALSDKAVWRLVKQAARDAGLANPEGYSGHSLRAGLATAAGDAGADLAAVMRQTRHRSAKVALGYLRPAQLWRNNASQKVWKDASGNVTKSPPSKDGAAEPGDRRGQSPVATEHAMQRWWMEPAANDGAGSSAKVEAAFPTRA